MAKWRKDKDEPAPDEGLETPSNTTSGGETPEAADGPATVEDGAAEGTAVYPPSPSDQAGEKTDNVAPSKRLPPDPPEGEAGADELTTLRAERDALAAVCANLGGNPAAVAKAATDKLPKAKGGKKKGPVKKATVTPKGGDPVEVEYPAGAKDGEAAAVEAYKDQCGIWSLGDAPRVELKD